LADKHPDPVESLYMKRKIKDDPDSADMPPTFREPSARAVMAWIERKAGTASLTCQVCSRDDWSVSPVVGRLPAGFDELAVASYPLVPVVCTNCGNTLLLNALVMGLFDDESGGGHGE